MPSRICAVCETVVRTSIMLSGRATTRGTVLFFSLYECVFLSFPLSLSLSHAYCIICSPSIPCLWRIRYERDKHTFVTSNRPTQYPPYGFSWNLATFDRHFFQHFILVICVLLFTVCLYCLYCVFVLFVLCVCVVCTVCFCCLYCVCVVSFTYIIICFVCTGVRTAATEWHLKYS